MAGKTGIFEEYEFLFVQGKQSSLKNMDGFCSEAWGHRSGKGYMEHA